MRRAVVTAAIPFLVSLSAAQVDRVAQLAHEDLAVRRAAVAALSVRGDDAEAVARALAGMLADVARFPPVGEGDVLGWNAAVGMGFGGRAGEGEPFGLEEPDTLLRAFLAHADARCRRAAASALRRATR